MLCCLPSTQMKSNPHPRFDPPAHPRGGPAASSCHRDRQAPCPSSGSSGAPGRCLGASRRRAPCTRRESRPCESASAFGSGRESTEGTHRSVVCDRCFREWLRSNKKERKLSSKGHFKTNQANPRMQIPLYFARKPPRATLKSPVISPMTSSAAGPSMQTTRSRALSWSARRVVVPPPQKRRRDFGYPLDTHANPP